MQIKMIRLGSARVFPGIMGRFVHVLLFLALIMAFALPAYAQDLVVAPAATNGAIWYVDKATGVDGLACGTLSAPCASIQAAINRAASGDTILVAAGIYTYISMGSCASDTGATSVVCVYNKRVTLLGGYPSGNWSLNDPALYTTVIDGENKNRGAFVLANGSTGSMGLSMEGFTIRNGYGPPIPKRTTGPDSYYGFGGAMFVENVGVLTLKNMQFLNNRAVGAERSAGPGGAGVGGAISLRKVASVTIENVLFENNQALGATGPTRGGAAHGGAIFSFETTLVATNATFRNNLARAGSSNGDGEYLGRADALGGAVNFQERSNGTLRQIVATGNRAIGGNATVNSGGGYGGAVEAEEAAVTIVDAYIKDNLALGGNGQNGWFGSGGGIATINSTLDMNRVQVINNVAQGGNGTSGHFGPPNGGGVTVSWDKDGAVSRFTMNNTIIAGNRATTGQGAQVAMGGAGGLWIQATEALIDHSTIADNTITGATGVIGQGFWILNTGDRRYADVIIRRSVISGHSGQVGSAVEIVKGNKVTFETGLFYKNTWDTSATYPIVSGPGNAGVVNGLGTMQHGDPTFVAAGDYHIKSASSARNQVVGNSMPDDFENEGRMDGKSDFGADEYTAPSRPPLNYTSVNADLNSIVVNWDLDPEAGFQIVGYRLTNRYSPNKTSSLPVTDVLDVGMQTGHVFTDLDPYIMHEITVEGLDSKGAVVVSTTVLHLITTDQKIHLPLVRR